jgi:hypothetical protein
MRLAGRRWRSGCRARRVRERRCVLRGRPIGLNDAAASVSIVRQAGSTMDQDPEGNGSGEAVFSRANDGCGEVRGLQDLAAMWNHTFARAGLVIGIVVFSGCAGSEQEQDDADDQSGAISGSPSDAVRTNTDELAAQHLTELVTIRTVYESPETPSSTIQPGTLPERTVDDIKMVTHAYSDIALSEFAWTPRSAKLESSYYLAEYKGPSSTIVFFAYKSGDESGDLLGSCDLSSSKKLVRCKAIVGHKYYGQAPDPT